MLDHARTRIGAALVFIGALSGAAYARVASAASGNPTKSLSTTLYKEIKAKFLTTSEVDHKFLKTSQLEQKLVKLVDTPGFDVVLNKQLKLDTGFLKIDDAAAQFLKITDASAQFLKIDAANAQFLKITEANARFLKIDGTAANSNELGGLHPTDFLQGHGQVLSADMKDVDTTSLVPLLSVPGVAHLSAKGSQQSEGTLEIVNDSQSTLHGVADIDSSAQDIALAPGASQDFVTGSGDFLTRIQITDGSSHAVTFEVSQFPSASSGGLDFVAQALIGLL